MECVLRFIDAGFLAARISKKSSIFCAPAAQKPRFFGVNLYRNSSKE